MSWFSFLCLLELEQARCIQPHLTCWLRCGLANSLPSLDLNHNLTDLCLWSSWERRHKSLSPGTPTHLIAVFTNFFPLWMFVNPSVSLCLLIFLPAFCEALKCCAFSLFGNQPLRVLFPDLSAYSYIFLRDVFYIHTLNTSLSVSNTPKYFFTSSPNLFSELRQVLQDTFTAIL
jgi:hypothetical protein